MDSFELAKSEWDIEQEIEDIMETMVHNGCDHISMEQGDFILFALRFLKSNLDEEVINTINGKN
tara:strand:+ start:127 stop:318 length:192 start_codon:yes stop_codon:yes gene_type:complete